MKVWENCGKTAVNTNIYRPRLRHIARSFQIVKSPFVKLLIQRFFIH